MKSKRRHELQTNELADQIGQWIERVRPYATLALVLVGGALLALAAWYYLASGHDRKLAESWRSYMLAGTNPQGNIVEELSYVADEFGDTPAGQWAALTAADVESVRGIRQMFSDRAAAETSLNSAKNHYLEVLANKRAAENTLLTGRTHFGLAQTYEAQGELEEAKQQYAAVVASDKESALGKAAQKRLDRLELAATRRWYNWFDNQKPVPRELGTGPGASSPLGAPASDLGVLPEGPSESFLKEEAPAAPKPDTPPAAAGEPAKDAPVEPAAPAEPAKEAPTEPAKDAPAAPAQDATPADGPSK